MEFLVYFVILSILLFAVASFVGKFIKRGHDQESESESIPDHRYDYCTNNLTTPVYTPPGANMIHYRLSHGLWWALAPGSKYWVASRDNQD